MISKITIKDVASYSPDSAIQIETSNKRVNLFFGLNGSGKSTIGNYLQSPNEPRFSKCSIESSSTNSDVLVYNQNFIERTFYQKANQPGIFSVGEENRENQEEINSLKNEIELYKRDNNKIEGEIEYKKREIKSLESQLEEKIWQSRDKYLHTSLDFCVKKPGHKSPFLQKVLKAQGAPNKTIEDLMKLAAELAGDRSKKERLNELSFENLSAEDNDLLSRHIVGSGDSYLSSMVRELNNSDWVKRGLDYLGNADCCPFCQQKISDDFKENVEKLFDNTYKESLSRVEFLRNTYADSVSEVKAYIENLKNISNDQLEVSLTLFENILDKNLSLLDEKIKNPSNSVELKVISKVILEINALIRGLNFQIDEFNQRMAQRDKVEEEIKIEFWVNVKLEHGSFIDHVDGELSKLKEQLKILEESYSLKKKDFNRLGIKLSTLQEKVSNSDVPIRSINKQLKLLGITGFSIVPLPDDAGLYQISRRDLGGNDVYATLSEGEKTIIAFLYFMELCFGSENKKEPVIIENRVVVIDDPISSLSHNFVFDVASLIYDKICCGNFLQVFIFTHNLYFFHELLFLKNPNKVSEIKGYNLFRVVKAEYTTIQTMDRKSLQNDYQMYWQIIRDCRDGKASPNILPNAMRNILEHYFGFIHNKNNLRKTLEELEGQEKNVEFKPFYRFISRNSHSDSVNLFDFNVVHSGKYIDTFEEIFRKTNFHEHFNEMMEG